MNSPGTSCRALKGSSNLNRLEMAFCWAASTSVSLVLVVDDWRHWPRVYAATTISSSAQGSSPPLCTSSTSSTFWLVIGLLAGGWGLLLLLLEPLEASWSLEDRISSAVCVSWGSEEHWSQGCCRHSSAVARSLYKRTHNFNVIYLQKITAFYCKDNKLHLI